MSTSRNVGLANKTAKSTSIAQLCPLASPPTRRFDPDHLGVGLHRFAQVLRVRQVHESVLDSIVNGNLGEIPEGPSIDVVDDANVSPGADEVDQRGSGDRTRRESQS